ncbi:MAG TPA: hypothetical protein VFY15_01805 [Acidimicrobiia bacterium]|nr:hypothetical protein [Acidimicrobiia bacterium]
MLESFPALLPATPDPMSRDEAAAASRALRHAVARYQSADDLPELLPFRHAGPALYRYSVTTPVGGTLWGLVGLAEVAGLLPHEETIFEQEDREAVDLEIRPLLAITRSSLPQLPEIGPAAEVTFGSQTHRAVPVAPAVLDLGTVVLADGHHRRRSALRHQGQHARAMTLVVGDSGRGLRADAFQRRLVAVGALPESVAESFEIAEAFRPTPRSGSLVWVEPGRPPVLLRPRPEALAKMPPTLRPIGAAVAAHLLYPHIGITQDRIEHFATGVAARHALGVGDAALLLPRVSIPAVLAAAAAGTLLPPKGSRFQPKPVRGLVVRQRS